MGASLYAPEFIQVQERFSISTTTALASLSAYTIALEFWAVLAAPLSESFRLRGVSLSSFVFRCISQSHSRLCAYLP